MSMGRGNRTTGGTGYGSGGGMQGAGGVANFFPASKISGLEVRNSQGEDLGKIQDLAIDVGSGSIIYAVLAFAGGFGAASKMFAVPWNSLQLRGVRGQEYFLLNIAKSQLSEAQGFDRDHWPSTADRNFWVNQDVKV